MNDSASFGNITVVFAKGLALLLLSAGCSAAASLLVYPVETAKGLQAGAKDQAAGHFVEQFNLLFFGLSSTSDALAFPSICGDAISHGKMSNPETPPNPGGELWNLNISPAGSQCFLYRPNKGSGNVPVEDSRGMPEATDYALAGLGLVALGCSRRR